MCCVTRGAKSALRGPVDAALDLDLDGTCTTHVPRQLDSLSRCHFRRDRHRARRGRSLDHHDQVDEPRDEEARLAARRQERLSDPTHHLGLRGPWRAPESTASVAIVFAVDARRTAPRGSIAMAPFLFRRKGLTATGSRCWP